MEGFAHSINTHLAPFLEIIVVFLNLVSILVLIWGVLKVIYDFLKSEWDVKDRMKMAEKNQFIKNYFGSYVLLSLEILIAADIMESILNPTFSDIARLAAIVVIRTMISYFLNREIKESH